MTDDARKAEAMIDSWESVTLGTEARAEIKDSLVRAFRERPLTDRWTVERWSEPLKRVGGTVDHQLAELGRWVLREHRRDMGDLGGDAIQEKALELGLLRWVRVTEPCGEVCFCAEWDAFPQDCLRVVEGVGL
jgi:hypothetical protein